MRIGFGFCFMPFSWAFGPWNKTNKWLFAVGPFRVVYYKDIGAGPYGKN